MGMAEMLVMEAETNERHMVSNSCSERAVRSVLAPRSSIFPPVLLCRYRGSSCMFVAPAARLECGCEQACLGGCGIRAAAADVSQACNVQMRSVRQPAACRCGVAAGSYSTNEQHCALSLQ